MRRKLFLRNDKIYKGCNKTVGVVDERNITHKDFVSYMLGPQKATRKLEWFMSFFGYSKVM